MADISKEEIRKEITAILKDADLTTLSAKKVRQQIEEKMDVDLTDRKKEVDDLVMECLKDKQDGKGKDATNKNKKNSKNDDEEEDEEEPEEEEEEDEEEDEEDEKPKKRGKAPAKKPSSKRQKKAATSEESEEGSEDQDASDEEYSPKKGKGSSAKKGKGAAKKKKKGSDSDSDEDWAKSRKSSGGGGGGGGAKKGGGGKRGGGGYTRAYTLSPELAAVVGQDSMARHEVVKKIWAVIKEKNLYDPKNKQFAICDNDLLKVIGVKRFRIFGMMKYLKNHFID